MSADVLLKGERYELAADDSLYPQALALIARSPRKLFVVGDPHALREGLAVIGARKATPYGRGCARRFASIAAERGIVIISGGARGCDAAAHEAALEVGGKTVVFLGGRGCARRFASIAAERGIVIISGGARGCDAAAHEAALEVGGKTVVFLGGGCDRVYPFEHKGLFQRVVDAGGAVVSEQPWECDPRPYMFRERNRLIAGLARATLIVEAGLPSGTFSTADEALAAQPWECDPRPYMFRERNRLIAGLARATLIVEAGLPSGTFSTADEALAANRDVLVVPGSITSVYSRGANRLIYQGATPVVDEETFGDQLFDLFGCLRYPWTENREGDGVCEGEDDVNGALLESLRAEPLGVEELVGVARLAFGEEDVLTTSVYSRGANRLIYQGATPVVDEETFGDQLFDLFGCLRYPRTENREGDGVCEGEADVNGALLESLRAEPLGVEELVGVARLAFGEEDVLTRVMVWLAKAQSRGLIAQYPDGRYGPAMSGSPSPLRTR